MMGLLSHLPIFAQPKLWQAKNFSHLVYCQKNHHTNVYGQSFGKFLETS